MLRAIVFDFDGVIADSEPLHLRAAQTALRTEGIELDERQYYDRYLGFDDEGMFKAVAADRGLSLNEKRIEALIACKAAAWMTLVSDASVLFSGAADCIRRCAAQKPLAIASGAFEHEIELLLSRAALRQFFVAIASASDGVDGKPAPDLYVLALSKLHASGIVPGIGSGAGNANDFVAIEDSRWGIDAAHAAGLRCVAVTHTYPAAELASADLVVDSLEEVTVRRLEQICGS